MYTKIIGDQALLALAQSNLLSNLDQIVKRGRMHTYFAFNGQSEEGASRNTGNERCYSWEDTLIDCRNAPNLVEDEGLEAWLQIVSENLKFKKFKELLEEKMGGHITIEPFCKAMLGKENGRYNIRLDSKVEDFDSIRVGIKLKAENEGSFKKGLEALKASESPFQVKHHHPLENDLKV